MLRFLSIGAQRRDILVLYLCFSLIGAIFTDSRVHMAHGVDVQYGSDLAVAEILDPDSWPEAFEVDPVDPGVAAAKETIEILSELCLELVALPMMSRITPVTAATQRISAPCQQLAWSPTTWKRPPRKIS